MHSGQWAVDNEEYSEDSGPWTVYNEQWTERSGQ
jgi:hypothetical protein